ncbi:MAG: L-glutamate gamma-semialdehyde dehydrogenase [Saprospiraceae bacterium]
MSNAFFQLPAVTNEPVKGYAPGSKEKAELKAELKAMKSQQTEIKMYINGEDVSTDDHVKIYPPHELNHCLGYYHRGTAAHAQQAIDAALAAKPKWEAMAWQDRASIFLRAAELIAGPYRAKINAATMLGQSKNAYQAEIDAAAELIDFLKFNAQYMVEIYSQQPPANSPGVWNRLEYRALEGFVFAVSPFNFTSICANLFATPVMLGNVAVWKPSDTQIYSAGVIMEIFREAGLPAGVVNMVFGDGPTIGEVCFNSPDLAGLHFTGSTKTFQYMWKTIGENIHNYKAYPRIVGETGGKDFVMVHPSADQQAVVTALSRGAFEYQGQKCSAASRAYVPASMWDYVKEGMRKDIATMKMGTPEDFSNFINAVIDERAFDKISTAITAAKGDDDATIVAGGGFDKTEGYFIEPTVIQAHKADYATMKEELFGPVLTIFVYEDDKFEETLDILDKTSPYALTGAVFSKDRYALQTAVEKLRNSAGNFYINDKPTGAVVGQQPFGGGRASGTNDKAGSIMNLYRWLNARTIKENFNSPKDYRYSFLDEA